MFVNLFINLLVLVLFFQVNPFVQVNLLLQTCDSNTRPSKTFSANNVHASIW